MADSEYSTFEKRAVLIAACVSILVNPLAGSMLNLALGSIQADFGCSEHNLGWIASIYFIVSVIFVLPLSKAADIYGKKLIFILGAIIATLGLILSVFSQDIWQLYIYRALTAMGVAGITGTGVAMISDVYAANERGWALGIHTACVYIGASIGPTLGGILTENFGWSSIFWFLVPLTVLAAVFMTLFPHNIKRSPDSKMDLKGSFIYGLGIFVMMFGVISLPELYAIAMIIIGVAILAAFVILESKVRYPIFKGSLFRNSCFSRSMLALFLNYASSYCVTFFLSRYLQEIGAMTPTQAGLMLIVQPILQVIVTLIAGRCSDMIDKRILPTAGMISLCIGLVLLLFLGETVNVPLLVVSQIVMGIGFGLFSAPNTNAIMSYVKSSDYGSASGLIAVGRQTGMMISMGLATCLIAVMLGTETVLVPENYGTFIDVMRTAWCICIVFSLIGITASWFRGTPPAE